MERRKKPRFLRKDWHKCIRLGRKKKNLVWRRSRGRHGKVRQKWKSRQKMPSIGYGMPREIRGKIKGLVPMMINNEMDLQKAGKGSIALLSRTIGKRKRMDIAKKAIQLNVQFENFNPQKFLDEMALKAKKPKAEQKPKKEEKAEVSKKKEEKK